MAIVDRATLLHQIKGQEVHVPDIGDKLLSTWPAGVNVHRSKLETIVNARLHELVPSDPKKTKGLKKADFALFASSWWPYAEFEELRIVCYLAIWLFLWDDEIDESTGSLTNDLEGANTYRKDTVEFIRVSLGLDSHAIDRPMHPCITSFAPIGDALKASYTHEQRQDFMDQMLFFMQKSLDEQRMRLSGDIPSVPAYWETRMGTSAVGVCSAVIEFAHRMQMPRPIMADDDMKILWDETNVIVFITNDILSVKKELVHDNLDSLIPIRCADGVSAQTSIEKALRDLAASIARFDDAALRLQEKFASSSASDVEALDKFIEASKQNCTGNLYWSSVTGRYGLADAERGEDNEIVFTL